MAKKEIVTTKWLDNMAFESEADGHKIILDANIGGITPAIFNFKGK